MLSTKKELRTYRILIFDRSSEVSYLQNEKRFCVNLKHSKDFEKHTE